MKAWRYGVTSLMAAGLLIGCASEKTYHPNPERTQQLSLMQARDMVRAYRGNGIISYNPMRIEVRWSDLQFIYKDRPQATCRFDHARLMIFTSHAQLAGCPSVHNPQSRFPDSLFVYFDTESEATRFLDAVYVLKQNYLAKSAPETPQQQAAFDEIVRQYRAAQPPPALPEEVRRYMVQAESAVKEKRFEDAVDAYDQSLRLAPWWPQAHFNLALLFGELEEYSRAQTEMTKYLRLVPEAPNVRAAKDKIYEWEGKTRLAR